MMNSNPSFPAFTEGEGEGRTGGKSKEGKFFQPLLVIGRSREGVGWGGEGGTNLSQSRETTSEVIVRKRRSRRKREMNNEVWAGAEEDEGGGGITKNTDNNKSRPASEKKKKGLF